MDELEVYGTEAQAGTELASYTFEVRTCVFDSIICLDFMVSLLSLLVGV